MIVGSSILNKNTEKNSMNEEFSETNISFKLQNIYQCSEKNDRSSRLEVFLKTGVLKICSNLPKNTHAEV